MNFFEARKLNLAYRRKAIDKLIPLKLDEKLEDVLATIYGAALTNRDILISMLKEFEQKDGD